MEKTFRVNVCVHPSSEINKTNTKEKQTQTPKPNKKLTNKPTKQKPKQEKIRKISALLFLCA